MTDGVTIDVDMVDITVADDMAAVADITVDIDVTVETVEAHSSQGQLLAACSGGAAAMATHEPTINATGNTTGLTMRPAVTTGATIMVVTHVGTTVIPTVVTIAATAIAIPIAEPATQFTKEETGADVRQKLAGPCVTTGVVKATWSRAADI